MTNTILITDSLFIFPEHEQQLKAAGFEIERLDKPMATEEELIAAVKSKVGYILGGIEKVTDKVIEAADSLKVISFTGSDWRQFIPGHELATQKGIAITNAAGANAYAVAEYTLALMLSMTRNLFDLGRTGEVSFKTSRSLKELTVGIIGMGKIGTQVATMLKGLGVQEIVYYSRTQKPDVEEKVGMRFVDLDTLLKTSNIVTIHVPKATGPGVIDATKLAQLKDGSLIINCAYPSAIDPVALLAELQAGRIRAAQDDSVAGMEVEFNALPLSTWFNSNMSTAYNTYEANKKGSDMATESILNILSSGQDGNKVN